MPGRVARVKSRSPRPAARLVEALRTGRAPDSDSPCAMASSRTAAEPARRRWLDPTKTGRARQSDAQEPVGRPHDRGREPLAAVSSAPPRRGHETFNPCFCNAVKGRVDDAKNQKNLNAEKVAFLGMNEAFETPCPRRLQPSATMDAHVRPVDSPNPAATVTRSTPGSVRTPGGSRGLQSR